LRVRPGNGTESKPRESRRDSRREGETGECSAGSASCWYRCQSSTFIVDNRFEVDPKAARRSALNDRECEARFLSSKVFAPRPVRSGSSSTFFRLSYIAAFSACLRVTASFSNVFALSHRSLAAWICACSVSALVSGLWIFLIFSRCLSF